MELPYFKVLWAIQNGCSSIEIFCWVILLHPIKLQWSVECPVEFQLPGYKKPTMVFSLLAIIEWSNVKTLSQNLAKNISLTLVQNFWIQLTELHLHFWTPENAILNPFHARPRPFCKNLGPHLPLPHCLYLG